MSAIVVPTSNGLSFTLTFELYKSATLLNTESNKNQTSAKGNNGLKMSSKTKQRLFGFPCHRIFSSLPTISSNSVYA